LVRRERRLVLEVNAAGLDHPVIAELAALLNMKPRLPRYEIVVAPGVVADPRLFPGTPHNDLELSTRSNAQVFYYLSNGVEVPPEHLESGVAISPVGADGAMFDPRAVTDGLFAVHSAKGHKPPKTAYLAVKERGYWYYIDDRDQISKATLALVLQMSRLDFSRQTPAAPFLTLPVGR
jgi:hypothetical protein